MARYIDVDKAMPLIDEFGKRYCMTVCNILNCKEIIAKIPTADVQEVRHGHWIREVKEIEDTVYFKAFCSVCNRRVIVKYNFCPHCGAKMGEEEKK